MNPESHAGTWGWVALGTGVLVWDILAPETLSHAVDRVLETPRAKYIAYGVGGLVAGHLFNVYDSMGLKEYDPISRLGRSLGDIIPT